MAEDGVIVEAYALEVVDELPAWREMPFRDRRWFSVKDAFRGVGDPIDPPNVQALNEALIGRSASFA